MGRLTTPQVDILLREARLKDLEQLLALELVSFEFSWSTRDFAWYSPFCRRRGAYICVATVDDEIVGYIAIDFHRENGSIDSIAADPTHYHQGIASGLLRFAVSRYKQAFPLRLTALVRERNTRAQLFFRAQRFTTRQTRRRPYQGTDEDGYVFSRTLWTPLT